MSIYCLGLNHNSANLDLRERANFDLDEVTQFCGSHVIKPSQNEDAIEGWDEMVLLSTCNRVEVYCVSDELSWDILGEQLAVFKGLPADEMMAHTYRFQDEQAVSHLFRVAAGLDSMVIGEAQILGQVAEALEAAQKAGSAGKTLTKFFQAAIQAGKRVRTETAIGEQSVSVSSLAARLVEQKLNDLSATQVVLLGAGEMSELAIEALRKRGVENIRILNRSLANACDLAERWQGQAETLDALPQALVETDVLISSTSAPHTIITPDLIKPAMDKRPPGKDLIIIDIAVPRDVEPEVADIPGVHLFDIDGLNLEVERSLDARRSEIPLAETILMQEYQIFIDYLASENVLPIILEMRKKADRIRQRELEKALKRLPELTPEGREQLDTLTASIVNKILHHPTIRLRQASAGPQVDTYAEVTQELFGLEK